MSKNSEHPGSYVVKSILSFQKDYMLWKCHVIWKFTFKRAGFHFRELLGSKVFLYNVYYIFEHVIYNTRGRNFSLVRIKFLVLRLTYLSGFLDILCKSLNYTVLPKVSLLNCHQFKENLKCPIYSPHISEIYYYIKNLRKFQKRCKKLKSTLLGKKKKRKKGHLCILFTDKNYSKSRENCIHCY